MGDPLVYLGILAGLFLLGALGEIIFAKTQIPDVVWLIAAGVLLRVTGLVDPTQFEPILPLFTALTLIIVLFDGGSQLVIKQLIKAAPRASLMALLGFVITMFAVAGLTMLAGLSGLLDRDARTALGFTEEDHFIADLGNKKCTAGVGGVKVGQPGPDPLGFCL